MLSQRPIIQQTPDLTARDKEPVKICVLINSIFYFFSCVFILRKNGKYKLVVMLNNRIVHERLYNSLRGAKIAFVKLFQYKAWYENVKAEWTHFYNPDQMWLDEKLQIAESAKMKSSQISKNMVYV